MGIFDFERLFDLNHDGTLDPLEKGLEFTVIEDIMNDDEDEDNDDLNFSIEFISLIFLFIVILFKRYSL